MKKRLQNFKQKIKIAFIFNHSFFLGGGERSFYELIRTLDKVKFEPLVVVPEPGEIERTCRESDIPVFVSAFPSFKKLLGLQQVKALLSFHRVLKISNADIIHVNGSRACCYSIIAGMILGVPVIWHVRETKQDYFLYDGALGVLSRKIICVSNAVKIKRFSKFSKLVNKKIEIIYNGVDSFQFRFDSSARKRIRDALGIDSEILIGLVGNIIPLKGHDFFLKGLAKAKIKAPDLSVKVLFVGRQIDKNYNNKIRKIIEDEGLDNDVIFMDYMDRITDILSSLDIFVLPSRREGFSRSLIEAMSVGLPILASKIEAIEEAARNEENALLVDRGDEAAMASAIIRLCRDAGLRNEMGEKNRKKAEQSFDLKCHSAKVERIYKEIMHPYENHS